MANRQMQSSNPSSLLHSRGAVTEIRIVPLVVEHAYDGGREYAESTLLPTP